MGPFFMQLLPLVLPFIFALLSGFGIDCGNGNGMVE